MKCFVDSVLADSGIQGDIRQLIPDAGLRRRMGRLVRTGVATAVECMGGIGNIAGLDAIITATGWGFLADSERFLRNIIGDGEQMLNPTPFIQSTFNTVGGQIALLAQNHCYNVSYANRSHSFEDALLDAMMRMDDGEAQHVLVGAFDECTPALQRILGRMGLLRSTHCGEGAVFAHLTASPTADSVAEVACPDFPAAPLSEEACRERYATRARSLVLYGPGEQYGLCPTASAQAFARGIAMLGRDADEVVIYNESMGGTPSVIVVRCTG